MKKYYILAVFTFMFSCNENKNRMYRLDSKYVYEDDFVIEDIDPVNDSFYASSRLEAIKKGSKIFMLKAKDRKILRTDMTIYDEKNEKIDLENLTDSEKLEIRKYLKPVLDSLALK